MTVVLLKIMKWAMLQTPIINSTNRGRITSSIRPKAINTMRKDSALTSLKMSSTCFQERKNNKLSKESSSQNPNLTLFFKGTPLNPSLPTKTSTPMRKSSINYEKNTLICATWLRSKNYNTKNKWKSKGKSFKTINNKKFRNSKIKKESWKDS